MSLQTTWAKILGFVLLIVGVLGFFMTSPLLSIFEVDFLHNLIHVVTGLLGIWAAFGGWATMFNKWFGSIYLLLAILGFFGAVDSIMAINAADHWLHLIIGLVTVGIGFGTEAE
ncbi:MAG TPA: DUF4383 domain-containing protein [Candidatus Nanoarchaeia archaeon]|nr:DUF4383 domain-containing protein [Candidatus Nanoarchaeia archaeon]